MQFLWVGVDFLSFSIWQTPTFLFLFNSRFLQVSYWSLSLSHLITVKSVLSLVLNHLTHHSTTELKYTPSLIDSEGRVPLDFCVSRNWDSNAMTPVINQLVDRVNEWPSNFTAYLPRIIAISLHICTVVLTGGFQSRRKTIIFFLSRYNFMEEGKQRDNNQSEFLHIF